MSLKEKLLAARARFKREPVADPEVLALLGGEPLFVRELSQAERDDYEQGRIKVSFVKDQIRRETDFKNLRARLLVKVLVGEDGKRAFSDLDATELGQVPSRYLTPLFEQAQRVSGLDQDAEKELEKNLSGPGDGSPSA